MSRTFHHPMRAAQAYDDYSEKHQEFQGRASSDTTLIPLTAGTGPSSAMDKKQSIPRKLSRGKSRKSLFSRKSSKKVTDMMPQIPTAPLQSMVTEPLDMPGDSEKEIDEQFIEGNWPSEHVNIFMALSMLPEIIPELPAWYSKELEWVAGSAIQFRAKYPVHNNFGPRYYYNYHLIPASELEPATRPPSLFSPSFPPMTTPDAAEDAGWVPPSRTPSGSPLPTPNSSQVKINDLGPRVRSRKTSQTVLDNTDMLDVTDPWGSHWHHESPYEILNSSSPVLDLPEGRTRSRMSSMSNTPARHRTVIPSPLSQSTSALHLQPPNHDGISMPRSLSKRRRPGIRSFFGGNKDDPRSLVVSAPTTPMETTSDYTKQLSSPTKLSRTSSWRGTSSSPPAKPTSPTPTARSPQDIKKRGSIFGAFAKKFTVTRKHSNSEKTGADVEGNGQQDGPKNVRSVSVDSAIPFVHERKTSGLGKRVPPPSVESQVQPSSSSHSHGASDSGPKNEERLADDHASVMEAPFSIGKLTIANPDAASSGVGTPARSSFAPTIPEKDVVILPPNNDQPRQILQQIQLVAEPEQVPEQSRHETDGGAQQYGSQPVVEVAIAAPEERPAQAPAATEQPPLALSAAESTSTDDTPLSRASMIVNPPTPLLIPVSMPAGGDMIYAAPTPTVTATSVGVTSMDTMRSTATHDTSRSKSKSRSPVNSRETETFRLMRSPSGSVRSPAEGITANGEVWEIVEAKESISRRSRTKERTKERTRSPEQDSMGHKDGKAYERGISEREDHRPDSRDRQKIPSRSSMSPMRARSVDGPRRPAIPDQFIKQGVSRSQSRERRVSPDKRARNGISPAVDVAQQPGISGVPFVHSQSIQRPTSDIQSPEDLETVRAREAWEMERLFKGRSLEAKNPIAVITPAKNDQTKLKTTHSKGHGSSHTSVVVQSPFRGHRKSLSSAYANPPPPTVYAVHAEKSQHPSPSSYEYKPNKSSQDSVPFPSSRSSTSRVNPLPEPPRESKYRTASIPAALSDNGPSQEYWKKYAGLTTATTAH